MVMPVCVMAVAEKPVGAAGVRGVNVYFVPLVIAAVFALFSTPYAQVGPVVVTLAYTVVELARPIDAPAFAVFTTIPAPYTNSITPVVSNNQS